ncbi:MAG TPA: C25 family cysteine peptidase [Pyrinomonadaceae bacterium]
MTGEVINSAPGGTPGAPLATLDPARYWQLSNSAALNAGARVRLAYDSDDNVFDTTPARVAQSSASNGSYTSIGGTVTGTTISGTIISTTNLSPGNDFFTIASESPLPVSWDGGAATTNWGDAANWSNDTVPTSTTDVSLSFGSPTMIDVNGTFSVKNLTVNTNTTLNFGSGTLNVTGNYIQLNGTLNINSGSLNVTGASTLNGGSTNVNSGTYLSTGAFSVSGGTLANGTGTLTCKADFTLSSGSFTVVTGTSGGSTVFSGTTTQNITGFAGGTSLNNLTLQGGGAGVPKRFTAGRSIVAANDFIVATTAQISLSAASATTIDVGGNLNYGGLTGGANIASLTLNLTGASKTINGTALTAPQLERPNPDTQETQVVNLFTDPVKLRGGRKDKARLESTYSLKRAEVDALLAKKEPGTRLVINLDDATIVSNPSPSFNPLAPTPSAFEMNVTVASGASYSLLDNISIGTGRTLSVTGRLNADTFTIGGAGNITVTGSSSIIGNGTIGTAATAASGLGATLINTGINTFTDAIIEYNASGAQTINVTNHPAAAMIYTAGSGTKTLNGNKTLTGDSGDPITKGALFVGSGTTFADGGFTLSFTSALGFANVIVNGTFLSTGSGGLSYESGPTFSTIQAVDGTQFGNLAMNFDFSTDSISLNASGTANISFRNLTFGGTAGLGVAGGTLMVNQVGVTNVIVNGNVSISPLTTSNTGGGFGGTPATVGTVTVKGNITTTSTNTTQPIFDNNGTNTLIIGHPSTLQTLTLGANATIFTGSNLRIDNPAGLQLGGTTRTFTLGSGGTLLVSAGASLFTGSNIFINSGATTVNGSFVVNTGGAASSGGAGSYSYDATLGTLVFNTTAATTIDANRTYWPAVNGPQNVSVIGAGGLVMSVARTVGILFQTTAAITGASSLTCNGTCRINAGGSFGTAPNYGSSSLLQYNTTFNRGLEWSATSGAGFPNDVQVSNNSTLDLGAGSTSTARAIARNLTIDAGSTFTTNGTGNKMTATLTVPGTILINGSLVLSTMNGADVIVGGNWTNNSTFTSNGKTVTFNGSSAQVIGGSTSTAFTGLTVSNSAGVTLNANSSVSGVLTLTNNLTTGSFILTQSGTSAGAADVLGNVQRNDLSATAKSFGNQFNTIAVTAGSVPANIVVNLVDGSPTDFANAVRRVYTITPSASGFTGTLQLHYNDADLNSNSEASLDLWRKNGSVWADQGATTRDSSSNFVRLTGVTQFSPWTLAANGNAPTAVRLTKFTAGSFSDGVQLNWESGYEVDNLGYHLYREQQNKRTRVTPAVVAGSALSVGPGRQLTAGYSYSWFDRKGTPDTAYYLEAIDLNGASQWHGPIYPYRVSGGSSPKRRQALVLSELADNSTAGGKNFESSWPTEMKAAARSQTLTVTPAGLAVQQSIAAGAAVKIQVNRSGWYRLTQPQLVAAGLDPSTDAQRLQLYVDGIEVPIQLSSNGPRLDANATLEFYGVGLDTPTTDTRTYWLIVGDGPGKRIAVKGSKPRDRYQDVSNNLPVGSFLYTTERREKLVYSSHLLNGDASNIFGAPVLNQPVNQTLTVKNFAAESTAQAQLEIALQGLTSQAHQVQVELNGSVLGTVSFTASEHPVAKFDVNPALLHEGDNEVSLVAQNGGLDISFIDSIRLSYAHQYRADNNELAFSVPAGQTVRVSGFTSSNVRVIDVTDPNLPLEIATVVGTLQGGYTVLVPASGQTRTFVAFADELSGAPISVTANNPSNWNASANAADMVIITHKDFRQAVEPLAALRRNQGLAVAVVDVEDVYDEFSYGAHTPMALKAFLAQAAVSWSRKPEYLLLVGDSSWDPRNYFQQGANDFVPTKLIDTSYMETASDDWFAAFTESGLPSMAIGRLPARTVAEVNLMVGKILSYEQERELNAPLRGAVMVADTGFESQTAETQNLLPATVAVETINRRDVGNDDLARGQIVDALNHGPMIVNYYGHGSLDVWTGAGLLDSDLARSLTNANSPSLYIMMTCLNGYSHDPYLDSLGEAALKAPSGGAVAVWASSGFTDAPPQFVMNLEFYRQLFGGEPIRLGQAIRNSKAAIADVDVRRTWILLGDPAMRIR